MSIGTEYVPWAMDARKAFTRASRIEGSDCAVVRYWRSPEVVSKTAGLLFPPLLDAGEDIDCVNDASGVAAVLLVWSAGFPANRSIPLGSDGWPPEPIG